MHRNSRHQQPKKKSTSKPYIPMASIYEQIQPLSVTNASITSVDLASDYLSILEKMSSDDIIKSLKTPSTKPSGARMLFERLQPHQRRALLEERALDDFSASRSGPSSTTSDSGLPGNGWFPAVNRSPNPFPPQNPLTFTITGSSFNDYTNRVLTIGVSPSGFPSEYGSTSGFIQMGCSYDFSSSTWNLTGFTVTGSTPVPNRFWRSPVAGYGNGAPPPGIRFDPVSGIIYPLSTVPTLYNFYRNTFNNYLNLTTPLLSTGIVPDPTEYVIQDNTLYLNRYSPFISTVNTVSRSAGVVSTIGFATNLNFDYFSNTKSITLANGIGLSSLSINNQSVNEITVSSPATDLRSVTINAPQISTLILPSNAIYNLNVSYSSTLSAIFIGRIDDSIGYKNLVVNADSTNLSSGTFICTLSSRGYNWYDGSLSANFVSLYNKNWSFGSTTLDAYQVPLTYTPSRSTYNKLIVLSPGTYTTTGTFLSGEYTRTGTVVNNLDTWVNSNNSYVWFNSAARTWQVTNPGITGTVYLSTTVTNSTLIKDPPALGWRGLAYNANVIATGNLNYWAETQIIPMDCLQFNSYSYIASGANPIYRFLPTTSSGIRPASSYKFSNYNFSALGRNAGRAIDWSRLMMISPIHFIFASHFGVPNSIVYNFNRTDGSLTSGTVLTTRSSVSGDIGIGLLTAPLTGINPFRVIGERTYPLFKRLCTKLITVNQRAQVFDTITTNIPSSVGPTQLALTQSSTFQQLLASHEQNNNLSSVNNEDSSSPFLLPYTNGELLLPCYLMFAGAPASGPTLFTPPTVRAINNAMASLEAANGFTFGYTLSTV